MAARVVLPDGALIGLWDLSKAIARAAQPVVEDGASGIACVTAKLVDSGIPRTNLPLDQRANVPATDSEQEAQTEPPATDTLWLPFPLDAEDRRRLEEVLPALPELRYPISDARRREFLAAYRQLASRRLNWEPVLVTKNDVERQQDRQDEVRRGHVAALRHAFDSGRLAVYDANHIPVERIVFTTDCFIPRHSALAYLEQLGLAVFDTGSSEPVVIVNEDKTSEIASAKELAREFARRPEWTPEQYQELEDCYMAGGATPNKACVEKFGMNSRTVRKKRAEWAVDPRNPKVMTAMLAGK